MGAGVGVARGVERGVARALGRGVARERGVEAEVCERRGVGVAFGRDDLGGATFGFAVRRAFSLEVLLLEDTLGFVLAGDWEDLFDEPDEALRCGVALLPERRDSMKARFFASSLRPLPCPNETGSVVAKREMRTRSVVLPTGGHRSRPASNRKRRAQIHS